MGAGEILLWIDNEEPYYNQKVYMYKNLTRKKKKGTYDRKKAPKMFLNLTTKVGRNWNKEFSADQGERIPVKAYELAAKEMVERFESEYKNKEYDFME